MNSLLKLVLLSLFSCSMAANKTQRNYINNYD